MNRLPSTIPKLAARARLLLTPPTAIRVDKLLSRSGLCMRRDVSKYCREKTDEGLFRITLESEPGRILRPADKVDPSALRVDGEALPYAGRPLHIVLNKPPGYVCTHSIDEGLTVFSLLPSEFLLSDPQLATIGRLDRMSSGLLLLTQDGKLNDQLCNPRRGYSKTYMVALLEPLRGLELDAFASGRIQLVDGALCAPAELIPHPHHANVCTVILSEGRHHQLRRMFAEVGHTVTAIHRIGFGGLSLTSLQVKQGEWRFLTEDELLTLLVSTAESIE
jgi:16S rRNA pseudouridine516 synthase